MAGREELKRRAATCIDNHKEHLVAVGEGIFANPELGYKERETGQLIAEELEAMGLQVEKNLAFNRMQGYGMRQRRRPHSRGNGRTRCLSFAGIIPELTGKTGAAHACGHHIQLGGDAGRCDRPCGIRGNEGVDRRRLFPGGAC